MATDRACTPAREPGTLDDSWFNWPRAKPASRGKPPSRSAPRRLRSDEPPADDDLEQGWFDR